MLVALCRAGGIPARLVWVPNHNWAEFYDGQCWRVADPKGTLFMDHEATFMAMAVAARPGAGELVPGERFRVEGAGVAVKMNVD